MNTTRISRNVALLFAVALGLTACGEPADDSVGSSERVDGAEAAADSATGNNPARPGYGEIMEASITLSGPVDTSFGADPNLTYWMPGACVDNPDPDRRALHIELYVEDTTVESAIRPGARALGIAGRLEEDLSGGVTGTFDLSITVDMHDPPGSQDPTRYRGPATLDIVSHDVPLDLADRRMRFTLTGSGLKPRRGSGGEPLDLEADVVWVMGCR